MKLYVKYLEYLKYLYKKIEIFVDYFSITFPALDFFVLFLIVIKKL